MYIFFLDRIKLKIKFSASYNLSSEGLHELVCPSIIHSLAFFCLPHVFSKNIHITCSKAIYYTILDETFCIVFLLIMNHTDYDLFCFTSLY